MNIMCLFVGGTPLHHAARQGSAKMVELLLSESALINDYDREGWGALHLASDAEHHLVAQILLDNSAEVS